MYYDDFKLLRGIYMSNEVMIEICDLTKVYKMYDKPIDRLKESLSIIHKQYSKDFYALNNINLEIHRGENIGIIGTNGAGKSTLLKIITGVLTPTSGTVKVNGKISALLELGAGFNPEYSGIENIYLNGTMMGYSREEMDARVDGIMQFADIGDFIHQPVKTYSSGMFARLAFAVAINVEPEILIVDEALSVGDVFFQAKCYKKFEELKANGTTILFVSHDLSSVNKYCDRAILMNKGNKVAEGIPKDMIDLYKKYIVNQVPSNDVNIENAGQDDISEVEQVLQIGGLWKNQLELNPHINAYGNGMGEIIDFAIIDERNKITNTISKGTKFAIKMRAKFYADIEDPIFAFTILNMHGTEISGTNTMYEDAGVLFVKSGDEKTVTFTQEMNLQGGAYLLSLGLTGYRDGDFTVYHRLYEACSIVVVSEKNTVGFYDMNSITLIE